MARHHWLRRGLRPPDCGAGGGCTSYAGGGGGVAEDTEPSAPAGRVGRLFLSRSVRGSGTSPAGSWAVPWPPVGPEPDPFSLDPDPGCSPQDRSSATSSQYLESDPFSLIPLILLLITHIQTPKHGLTPASLPRVQDTSPRVTKITYSRSFPHHTPPLDYPSPASISYNNKPGLPDRWHLKTDPFLSHLASPANPTHALHL